MKIINGKKIGNNLNLVINEQKYSKRVTKEEGEAILKKIALYNKKNSDKLEQDIIALMTSIANVKAKQEVAKKSLEKKIEKETKNVDKVKIKEKLKIAKSLLVFAKNNTSSEMEEEISNLVISKGIALKGFEKVPMPDLLVERFRTFIENKVSIKPLLNFWALCLANPNHIARIKLFDYLVKHGLMITSSGYFVTYRMVKTTDKTDVYTHAYDGEPRLYYKVGEVATLNRETECDEDEGRDCSKGIHFGSPAFIGITTTKTDERGDGYNAGERQITKKVEGATYGTGYSAPKVITTTITEKFDESFGNQATIWLLNPMHVVSVPNSDTRKLRSCEGYFVKTTTVEEVKNMVASDYLLFDQDYNKIELKDIKSLIDKNGLKTYIEKDSYALNALTTLRKKLGDLELTTGKNKQDTLSKDLSLEQIKIIVKSRLEILK